MDNSQQNPLMLEDNSPKSPSEPSLETTYSRSSFVRFANPNNLVTERPIAGISVDNLLVMENDSNNSTENLSVEVSHKLEEIDLSIKQTTTELTENQETLENTIKDQGNSNIVEQQKCDWSADDIVYHNYPSPSWLLHQDFCSIMADKQEHIPYVPNKETEFLNKMITNLLQELKQSDRNSNQFESTSVQQIGFKEALNLLPKSCDGENAESLEIFLEKGEIAMSRIIDTESFKLLQSILRRLTGKARQIIHNRTFNTWKELKDYLKSNLEPQDTTQNLFIELYASKQKKDEDVLSYSTRVEKLQTLIIEQETTGLSIEIAQAIENLIRKQVLQVFVEGLDKLKGLIKSKNPTSLERAIQYTREEERVRTSSEETRQLYTGSRSSKTCNICKQSGHWAKDCRKKSTDNSLTTNFDSVHTITCRYCRKLGHTKEECRKLKYITKKRSEENNGGNHQEPGVSGGRPV